jgi:hypothetical protein
MKGNIDNRLAMGIVLAVLLSVLGLGCTQEAAQTPSVSPVQQHVESSGLGASPSIFPVQVAGTPFGSVDQVVGMLLGR